MQIPIHDAVKLALTLYQQGDMTRAIALCSRILKVSPDVGDAWHILGHSLIRQDKLDQALACLTRANELLPGNVQILDALASVHYRTCHFDAACATLREMQTLANCPEHVEGSLKKVALRLEALRHMEQLLAWRPVALALETVTICNSRCVFCAYRKIPRPKTIMSMALFQKICQEYAEMGGGLLGFNPLMSDPLVDPLFYDRLQWIVSQHHEITPHLFTNLIALSRFSDAQVLFMLRHLDYIDVSLGGVSRADYQVMFGVDRFEQVQENLDRLARLNDTLRWRCRVTLHFRTHKESDVRDSPDVAALQARGFKVADIINGFSDWGGVLKPSDLPAGCFLAHFDNSQKRIACVAPSIFLSILADGRVAACSCMDAKEEHILGNVSNQTLEAVWQGEAMHHFRRSFQENRIPEMCRHCSYYSEYSRLCSRPIMSKYRVRYDFWEFYDMGDKSF